MLQQVLLQPEQEDLLAQFVEAARSVPPERREPFLIVRPLSRERYHLSHPGWHDDATAYPADVEALLAEGFLRPTGPNPRDMLDVTPRGFAHYKEMKLRSGQPLKELESSIMDYLNGEPFRARYPEAHAKWSQASDRLWSSDSERELTVIGHLCREAMQAFASALVARYGPPDVDPNPQHDIARIRTVLAHRADRIGRTKRAFLDALLAYWGTVSDLVQRQEHGGQREGEPLVWEDGRLVVFQTANVMFELDRCLRGTE